MDFNSCLTVFTLTSKSSIPSLVRREFHCMAALYVKLVDGLEDTLMYVFLCRVALSCDEDRSKAMNNEYGSLNFSIFKSSTKEQ